MISRGTERSDRAKNLPQRVAVIVCAHNAGMEIASTLRACRAIPAVDLLIVVDDGSTDDTGRHARLAGAVVVRHSVERGKASAYETGVKVAAMRDRTDGPPRHILFLTPDIAESAVEASALVRAVMTQTADCACAVPPGIEIPVKRSLSERMAFNTIRRTTGWEPLLPLSEFRCMTREAVNAMMPFAMGRGLEVAMTIDLLSAGLRIVEVPCAFVRSGHLAKSVEDGVVSRTSDLWLTLQNRRVRRVSIPTRIRRVYARAQVAFEPYPPELPDEVVIQDSSDDSERGGESDSVSQVDRAGSEKNS